MNLIEILLLYLSILATGGVVIKLFQLWKEGKFKVIRLTE